MFRPRTLIWLAALVGASYMLWRWRARQAGAPAAPAAAPPRPTLAPAAPPLSGAAGPRRIATRVHRGAPPSLPLRPSLVPAADPTPISAEEAVAPDAPAAPPVYAADSTPISAEEAVIGLHAADEAHAADPTPISAEEAVMGQAPAGLVNINSADADALIALPGIGPALAARIIAHREQHGAFASVDQLIDIQGIGPANITEFRHLITAE